MLIPELIGFDRSTGRKIWAVRDIATGVQGDPWNASLVIVRSNWTNTAKIILAHNINQRRQGRELSTVLKDLGITKAYSVRHGFVKNYSIRW